MKEKLQEAFLLLQELEITATLGNMEKLTKALYNIQDVHKELTERGIEDAASAAE